MPLTLTPLSVPLRSVEKGGYRVGSTRVSLESVIYAYRGGQTAEEVVSSYSTLSLADVHSIIAFYLNHREEVDAYMTEREGQAAETRKMLEEAGIASKINLQELRERFLKRQQALLENKRGA